MGSASTVLSGDAILIRSCGLRKVIHNSPSAPSAVIHPCLTLNRAKRRRLLIPAASRKATHNSPSAPFVPSAVTPIPV